MRSNETKYGLLKAAALAGALLTTSVASAADVYLRATGDTVALPGVVDPMPMWFFVCDPDATDNPSCTDTAGSAEIRVTAGETLTIHVNNTLNVPTSVIVPGQAASVAGNPVFFSDGDGDSRVQSFTHEAGAGGSNDYTFNAVRAGTYLYQSGTRPSIQVPMGLAGALIVEDGSCYSDGAYCFDTDAVLLFSEVDPAQNAAVAAAAGNVAAYPSTVDYVATHLLINGDTSATIDAIEEGAGGGTVLLRMLNAGSRNHTPAIVGRDIALIAEDGNIYPGNPRIEAQALMPAGQTRDALIALAADDTIHLFDRTPDFTNQAVAEAGGLPIAINSGAGATVIPGTLKAMDDVYPVTEDTVLTVPAPGLLGNDTGLTGATVVSGTGNGTLTLNPDGSFSYTPNADFSGADGFTYSATDGADTYSAHVTLNVSWVNDLPVANDDSYMRVAGSTLSVAAPGVLGNDSDMDGDTLTAAVDGDVPPGLTFNADGSFEYTGNTGTTFVYAVTDEGGATSTASVELTIGEASNIALTVQEPDGTPVTAYHWVVEEDTNYNIDPEADAADLNPLDSLALNFHKSYMPVVAQGDGADAFLDVALDPLKHYYVSVLPLDGWSDAGHAMGGARILPGQTAVTVQVNEQPTPYAQISVFVFDDSSPTNGAVDGDEHGLGGFQITLEDAGGRYGASAGLLSFDANGAPLVNALPCFGGAPQTAQNGLILTCPDTPENQAAGVVGEALIKNLYPAKYGVTVEAPATQVGQWIQTSTIEGTRVIDAWVKANEPPFFQEFGPAGWHAFVGFVNPDNLTTPAGTASVTGAITNNHMSRPPVQTLWDSGTYDAFAHTQAYVGINSGGGTGNNYQVVEALFDEATGIASFELSGLPAGDYQLVVWDKGLDMVIGYRNVTLVDGEAVDVGNIPIFNWFSRLENWVFLDEGCVPDGGTDVEGRGDGIRQACEVGILEQNVNLRWRDGTVYAAAPTDGEGFIPFDQVFPFFHWQVAEVDFGRYKATGMTTIVDHGGDVAPPGGNGVYNPQDQDAATEGVQAARTETGLVLTQAFQGFLGQTSVIEWGKLPYEAGENGGISGIVFYSSTRAENDPRLGAAEPWEPGIPGVTVRLYRVVQKADGSEGLAFIDETTTDDWDHTLPANCPGAHPDDALIFGPGTPLDRCYDGLRNFNQVRPGIFDGGYAFGGGEPGTEHYLPAGKYVVEVIPPVGYEIVKEEDVNVVFGETIDGGLGFAPVAVELPGFGGGVTLNVPDAATVDALANLDYGLVSPCVGPTHEVPAYLSLFPAAMEPAPFAGSDRPLCNRKEVALHDRANAAADFFLLTNAPIAAHAVGVVLDDIAQEFNTHSVQFGEKWAPPFVPVSVRDYNGTEISRTLTDQYGRMNFLLPSTYSANAASPSGYVPNMLTTCMNDPGPIPSGGEMIIDPQYNPAYSNFCYTFQYMPGTTTYLDTPVLPVSAFASGYNPPDCAMDTDTPKIAFVEGTGMGPLVAPGGTLTIHSMGNVKVPNPAYGGPNGTGPKIINRNYGFGSGGGQGEGTVELVESDGTRHLLSTTNWGPNQIQVIMPDEPMTGQLVVTRGDNLNSTADSITVTVGVETPLRVPSEYATIQAAVDAAQEGELILVDPGIYEELVIMWKPVRLQGAGAGATFINAVKRPAEKILSWRTKMDCLFGIAPGCDKVVDALPNQLDGAAGFDTENGAGITVLGRADGSFALYESRIDGFSITGGDIGGGIFVNGYAHGLEISNDAVFGNSGSYHGGIRVGRPFLGLVGPGPYAFNEDLNIHHNAITQNGALAGAGGGLSLATGTDNYSVSENFFCGNFAQGNGAGIGHLGLSDGGRIANNRIQFNQSFLQGSPAGGGGIFIGGEPAAAGELTQGSGSVTIDANLIQGNQAASGHGGGIRTQFVNGQDVAQGMWQVTMTNNMVVNNIAGNSGGGISLQDTANGIIANNTVAHNDSTATVGGLIVGNQSMPQPAGISSELHSAELAAATLQTYSDPEIVNNIVWHNRAFHYDATGTTAVLAPQLTQGTPGDCDAGAVYQDLGVIGGDGSLHPMSSVLSNAAGYHESNSEVDPLLVDPYCNGGRGGPGPMFALPALDEGGNTWIDVRFGPLTAMGDYHIPGGSESPAADGGVDVGGLNHDFDGDIRPRGSAVDIGADETAPAPTLDLIDPASGVRGTSVPVTLVGNGLTGATSVNVTTNELTVVSFSVVDDNTITATFEVSNSGSRDSFTFYDVTVTTGGGTSNAVQFEKTRN